MDDGVFLVSNGRWITLQDFSNLQNYLHAKKNGHRVPVFIASLVPQYLKDPGDTFKDDGVQALIRLVHEQAIRPGALP